MKFNQIIQIPDSETLLWKGCFSKHKWHHEGYFACASDENAEETWGFHHHCNMGGGQLLTLQSPWDQESLQKHTKIGHTFWHETRYWRKLAMPCDTSCCRFSCMWSHFEFSNPCIQIMLQSHATTILSFTHLSIFCPLFPHCQSHNASQKR